MSFPDINDRNVFSPNIVYKSEDDWTEAPCYAKIFTHPKTGIADRIVFINNVVDRLNYCMRSLTLMREANVERDPSVVDKIRIHVLPLYKELIKKNCFPQDDAKIDPDTLDQYIRYLLSLGGNNSFYPASIEQLNYKKNTIVYLSTKLMVSLDYALRSEEKKPTEEARNPTRYLSLSDDSESHHGFTERTFIKPAGGKIRSAKRHPRRKSSAIKHRRRRTSRK